MYNKLNALQLSQAVGVHRTTVYQWLKAGLPRNKDKTFDLPAVIAWMVERQREVLAIDEALQSACDSPSLERYRSARASLAELDLRVKQGELVEKNTLDRALVERAALLKSDLGNMFRTHTPETGNIYRGDISYTPDVIDFWLEKLEFALGRYAR